MTDYTNGYFGRMYDTIAAYRFEKRIREAEKQKLMKANNWDAVKAWNEHEETEHAFPYSNGRMNAFFAWQRSQANSSSIFEASDLPWEEDAHDFVETLKEAGITEFAITDASTALMKILHALDKEGCQMVRLCKVSRTENRYGETKTEEYNGILMRI